MKYIKTFEDFINESIINEDNKEKIAKLKSNIQSDEADLANVPSGAAGSGAKKRLKDSIAKAKKELNSLLNEYVNENHNVEGDKKVSSFVKKLSKDWDIPVSHAIDFIVASLKRIDINESIINEASGTLKDKYEALIKNLEKAKIPCKVKLMDDEIVIECGWNFPDRIFDKVSDAADDANLKSSDINVCAEQDGGKVLDSKRINGGPKRY